MNGNYTFTNGTINPAITQMNNINSMNHMNMNGLTQMNNMNTMNTMNSMNMNTATLDALQMQLQQMGLNNTSQPPPQTQPMGQPILAGTFTKLFQT